jgi:hypothetical protein
MSFTQSSRAVALSFLTLAQWSCGASDAAPNDPAPSGEIAPPVQKGDVQRWPEATMHLRLAVDPASGAATVDLVNGFPPGLGAFWSIASTKGAGSGFFYSEPAPNGESLVALASVARVQDIKDARALDYSQPSIGPIGPGGVVVMHHPATDRYLAIVLDAIEPVDPRTTTTAPWAYADVTWYLAAPGSADFSGAR